MAQYNFGSGDVFATPTQDAFGAAIANPTPIRIGVLQDISVDISFDTKELYGQNQFPVEIGRGKGKIGWKAKYGQFNGLLLNTVFFGQTITSSILADYVDSIGAPIPATPFTVTPTVPNGGTWVTDLGVRDSLGNPMTKVASAPTAGQYSVTAGAYLFAAADTGKTVYTSFQYTGTSTTAKTSTVMNLPMGTVPKFRLDFDNALNGNNLALTLFACVSSKLALATKLDDFLIPEIDGMAFADPIGRVLAWGSSQ